MKRNKKSDVEQTGLGRRIHFWFCDRLGLMSVHEFDQFFADLDECFLIIDKHVRRVDDFAKAQDRFNRIVGERLHMEMKMGEESDERGVYQ